MFVELRVLFFSFEFMPICSYPPPVPSLDSEGPGQPTKFAVAVEIPVTQPQYSIFPKPGSRTVKRVTCRDYLGLWSSLIVNRVF
jgi:hypothetical protein